MSPALDFADVRAPVHGDALGGPWTFQVERGSWTALAAAPSVADAVAGLSVGTVAPTGGTVRVLGEEPSALSRFQRLALLRRMGVAFQREGLVSNLPLEENLVVPLVFGSGVYPAEARSRAREAMAELGLTPYAGRRPGALSRETRIVGALVRAALRGPELLILEHLTSGLPETLARGVLTWCRQRCETIVMLVPGPSALLDGLVDGWLPPLKGPKEDVPEA